MRHGEHEGLSLSASFHRAEGEKEERGFRTCPQHVAEKLTLYSARARCFGCVKCFQEGVLRGHQGQSLQRAHEEVKEKILRQHGALLQHSRAYKENQQVTGAADSLIEQERSAVHAAVQCGVESVKQDLGLKTAALSQAVEEWRQTKLSTVEAASVPLLHGIESIDKEMAQLKGWYEDDDETLLQTFYSMTMHGEVGDGEKERRVALVPCQDRSLPRLDCSQALRSCGHMNFAGHDDDDNDDPSEGLSSSGGPRRDTSDVAELDRVAVLALGNTEADKLSPHDRRLLWKHRVTLRDKKKALLKLLKCVQWDKERHVKQLLELVPQWVDVGAEDALEMLGASYMYGPIRALAVRSIASMPGQGAKRALQKSRMTLKRDLLTCSHARARRGASLPPHAPHDGAAVRPA